MRIVIDTRRNAPTAKAAMTTLGKMLAFVPMAQRPVAAEEYSHLVNVLLDTTQSGPRRPGNDNRR